MSTRFAYFRRILFSSVILLVMMSGYGCVAKRSARLMDAPLTTVAGGPALDISADANITEQAIAPAEAMRDAAPDNTEARLSDLDASIQGVYAGHVLANGDEIDIQVFREPEFSGTFVIDNQGQIRHPFLGLIAIAGRTVSSAEQMLLDMLAADYLVNPRVIVNLTKTQSAQIVVLGEVENPGVYPLPVGTSLTLLQAIALAGGFTEKASPDRVRIVRKGNDGNQTIKAKVSDLLSGGRQKDIVLEPDDIITVPEIFF